MFKTLRLIIACAIVLPIIAFTALLTLALYALEQEPLVGQTAPADYETVAAGKALLQRILYQVESSTDQGTTLAITEGELESLALLGSHTFQRINADVHFEAASIISRASLALLPNPAGEYLNLAFEVGQSDEGLGIERLSVGRLELPGYWVLPLATYLADIFLHDKQASLLLASVQGFRMEGNTALFSVEPPPDVKSRLRQVVKTLQASRFPPGEQERVLYYYEILARMGEQVQQRGLSVSDFMTPLMAEAVNRRHLSSAVAENRAVIWALTVYLSYGGFESLVGDLVSSQRDLVRPPSGVTLSGRWDLMAHFLYSAGITLATQQGIGIAAGEFKELLDSGGGSGFSFADLAADRAGIRFVAEATASESDARRLQDSIVANNSESAFFPDISGLPEGLGEAQFKERYGSTGSESYREQVALIDRRINRLPLYY